MTEVDVLDTQWVKAMWVNANGPKTYTPILHACVSRTLTSVYFIVRRFVIRLFSYLSKSILPLFYDSFVMRLLYPYLGIYLCYI